MSITVRIHESVEEFYNKYHDPKTGRFTFAPGGKAFARMSARPGDRTAPTPKYKLDGSEADAAEVVRSAYTTKLGGGYRSVVTEIEHNVAANNPPMDELDNNGFLVNGKIMQGKTEVGEFTRYIMQGQDGALFAVHELLDIKGDHQGRGIADRLNAHSVSVYQRMGVDRIQLEAELDVGGYAWARQGFRFDDGGNDHIRQGMLNEVMARAESNRVRANGIDPKQDVADRDALHRASDAGEDVQPIDIARIGEARARALGEDTWYGKEILLGNSWSGVFYFDATNPVTASAVELAYADARPKWRSSEA